MLRLSAIRSSITKATAARSLSTEAAVSYKNALLTAPETRVTTLANGLRVASEQTANKTATVGLYIDAGSRFETASTNGTAHFLEHMLFKGTSKRTQHQLELEVENMGAMLNAYTSREQTVYYAKCFANDINQTTEILSDLLLNCTLSPSAIEAERHVILREMQEVNGIPEEVVLDWLHTSAFQDSALGYTILGPEENIKSITQADLQNYISTMYTPDRIVLAAAGGIDHDELVGIADRYFGGLTGKSELPEQKTPGFFGSEIKARDDSLPTASVAIAVQGCSWSDPDYFPMMVANMIVGSWDRSFSGGANMSSRLAQRAAEFNLAHNYMSFHTSYSDTGLWGTYGVCDKMQIDDFIYAVQDEWFMLCKEVSDGEVERAKNQLKASMLFQNDGTTAVCEEIGRQMLTYGRRMYAAELDARIDSITTDQVKSVSRKYLYDKDPVVIGVGPIENMPDYPRIKDQMWSILG